eukprot:48169-Chlamydomonas_euryale.AAC.4
MHETLTRSVTLGLSPAAFTPRDITCKEKTPSDCLALRRSAPRRAVHALSRSREIENRHPKRMVLVKVAGTTLLRRGGGGVDGRPGVLISGTDFWGVDPGGTHNRRSARERAELVRLLSLRCVARSMDTCIGR